MGNPVESKHILQIFASPMWGGGEQYAFDLSKTLLANGYRVSVVYRECKELEDKLQSLPAKRHRFSLKNLLDIKSVIRLTRLINKEQIDIIHTHIFKDAFVALFARKFSKNKPRVVMTRHLVKKAKRNPLYKWFYKEIDKIIFVSNLTESEFLSSHPQIEADRMRVIHNSILPYQSTISDTRLTETSQLPENTLRLAFVGRIVKEKGIEILLESLKKIADKDFHLFIIGKGETEYTSKLKEMASSYQLDDKITFTGFIGDVNPIIKSMDVGVLPSVWQEPFGLTIIEFMQLGKAVITTNNGAQTEIISSQENGILVPPNDTKQLSAAIDELIRDKEKRIRLGENAQKAFQEQFSYPVFFEKILKVYFD